MDKGVIGTLGNHHVNSNFYDKMLILLIISLLFGTLGGAFRPIRVLIVFLIPFTMRAYFKFQQIRKHTHYEVLFFSIWIVYAFVSLVWVDDYVNGIKEIIYLMINFFGVITVIVFSLKASNPKNSILKGWYYLIVITIPIAFVEFFVGIHFPSSLHETVKLYSIGGELRRYAAINYGNLNNYNLVLIYALPFVIYYFSIAKLGFIKKVRFCVVLLTAVIIILNSSRSAFISLMLSILVFMIFGRTNSANKVYIKTMLISTIFVFLIFGTNIVKKAEAVSRILSDQGFEDSYRKEIISHSFNALEQSNYLGVGAGNFQHAMKKYIRDFDFFSSHNLFLEILTQYGVFIFFLFLIFLFKIFRNMITTKPSNKLVLFIVVGTLIPSSIITSNYILNFLPWLFFSSLLIFSVNYKKY